MIKKQVALEMSKKTDLTTQQAEEAINAYSAVVMETLTKGNSIFIRGFGTWENKFRKAKKVRNISKGTTFILPGRNRPTFKPCKAFKKVVE